MIEKVRLLNFISHADTTISLHEGVTVFVGKNGSGKSSVIDGITYAMYGKHTRKTNDNLVKRQTASGSASVEFSSAGRRFIVERKLSRKGQLEGSVLKEIVNGSEKQLASGERRQVGESVAGKVEQVIGLDYDRMKVAAIIQQGELASIVDLSAAQMKDLVNGLIGIDQLGIAHDMMLEIMNSFRKGVKSKHGYDDTDLQRLINEIAEQEQLATTSGQKLDSLLVELAALRAVEAELATKASEMEPLRTKADLLRQQIVTLVDYVQRARSELEQKHQDLKVTIEKGTRYLETVRGEEKVADESKRFADDWSENERLLQELSTKVATLEAQQERPAELSKLIEKARVCLGLVKRQETIRQTSMELESKVRDLESRINRMNEEKGIFTGQMQIAEKLDFKDGICPMCGSTVDSVREPFDREAIGRHLSEHEKILPKLNEEKLKVESVLEQARRDLRALDDAKVFLADNNITDEEDVTRIEIERNELAAQLSDLPRVKRLFESTLAAKTTIKKRVDELKIKEGEVTYAKSFLLDHQIHSQDDLERLGKVRQESESVLEALPDDMEGLKGCKEVSMLEPLAVDGHSKQMLNDIITLSVEARKFDEEHYERVVRELEELRGKAILVKAGEVERCKGDKERAESEIVRLRNGLSIAERTSDCIKVLETIREKVYHRDGTVSSSMRSWALNQIGLKASDYARLFGIGISTVTLKEKAKEITMECYGPRGMVEVDSLSGGEKVAIALALRFAMAYVMGGYKLDFVILDEPTVHLDEERRASMVEIISGLGRADSPLKQIIIITHDSEIFENAEVDAVYRFEASPEGTQVRLAP